MKLRKFYFAFLFNFVLATVCTTGHSQNNPESSCSGVYSNTQNRCLDASKKYNKAKAKCNSLASAGSMEKSSTEGTIENCANAIDCDDSSMFDDSDFKESDVTAATLSAFVAGNGTNPYAKKYQLVDKYNDQPDAATPQKCTQLNAQEKIDYYTQNVARIQDKLGKKEKQIQELSLDINKAKENMDLQQQQLNKDMQDKELDLKAAQADLPNQLNINSNNYFKAVAAYQQKITQDSNLIVSYTSGTQYQAVANQYKLDADAALSKCEGKVAALSAKGTLKVDITTLTKLAQGQTSSTNPFANNGALTKNYCSANNEYIMDMSAAYNRYILGLKALDDKIADVRAQQTRDIDDETAELARKNIGDADIRAKFAQRMAADDLGVQNDNKALQNLNQRSLDANKSMQGPIALTSKEEVDLAKALAENKAKLAAYTKQYPNLSAKNNDVDAEKVSSTDSTIQDGVEAEGELKAMNVTDLSNPNCRQVAGDSMNDCAKDQTQLNLLPGQVPGIRQPPQCGANTASGAICTHK